MRLHLHLREGASLYPHTQLLFLCYYVGCVELSGTRVQVLCESPGGGEASAVFPANVFYDPVH